MYHKGNEHTALDSAASPAYLMYKNSVEQNLFCADRDVTYNFSVEREAEWGTLVCRGRRWPHRDWHITDREVPLCALCTHTRVHKNHSFFLLFFPLAHCSPYLWCILHNCSVCIIRLIDSLSLKYCLPPNKKWRASLSAYSFGLGYDMCPPWGQGLPAVLLCHSLKELFWWTSWGWEHSNHHSVHGCFFSQKHFRTWKYVALASWLILWGWELNTASTKLVTSL